MSRVREELDGASRLKILNGLEEQEGLDPTVGNQLKAVRKNLTGEVFKDIALLRGEPLPEGLATELERQMDLIGERIKHLVEGIANTGDIHLPEGFELRPKQVRFFEKLKTYFKPDKNGHIKRSGFAKGPTGIGKTIWIALILRALIHHSDTKALVISPREVINKQNEEKIGKLQEAHVTIKQALEKKPGEKVDITISTGNMLVSDSKKEVAQRVLDEDYGLILLDECHRDFGEGLIRALRSRYPHAILIGLSATPYLGSADNPEKMRSAFSYFEGEIDNLSLKEACEEGDLAPIRANRVKLKQEDLDGYTTDASLDKHIDKNTRTKAAVEIAKTQIPPGEKTILFCAGVEHSKETAKALKEAGLKAAHVDGETPQKERDNIIDQFKKGEIQFICNSDLFIEGFDEPELKHAIMLRPTMALWMYEQMIGRVCRLDPNDPNKIATIWDVVGQHSGQCTIHGLSRFYGDMRNQFENGEILFGPPQLREKIRAEKRGPRLREQDPVSTMNITIEDVISIEEIATIRVPRDAYYYGNPIWIKADLEDLARDMKLTSPNEITHKNIESDHCFTCSNGEIIAARKYLKQAGEALAGEIGQTLSTQGALEYLKELAGFDVDSETHFPAKWFSDTEKMRGALEFWGGVNGLASPAHLRIEPGWSTGKHELWGKTLSIKEFIRDAGIALGITGGERVLEHLKKVAGYEITSLAEDEYFDDDAKVEADLNAFWAASGDPIAKTIRMGTVAVISTGERLTLGKYLERLQRRYSAKGKIRTVYVINILDELLKKFPRLVPAPQKTYDQLEPGSNPVVVDDLLRTATSAAQERKAHFKDDKRIGADLAGLATDLGCTLEELANQPNILNIKRAWGDGTDRTVGEYLTEAGRIREIVWEPMQILKILVAACAPKSSSGKVEKKRKLGMSKEYFDEYAGKDLAAFATAAKMISPGNLSLNNANHLNARADLQSDHSMSLKEYLAAYSKINPRAANERLALAKLLEIANPPKSRR